MQRERYLLASLNEYKDRKRTHVALSDIATTMSEADLRNVSAYFASLPPVANTAATDAKTPGTPTLAGQQPHYLVASILEYHRDDRKTTSMKSIMRDSDRLDLESLTLFFATQTACDIAAEPNRTSPAFLFVVQTLVQPEAAVSGAGAKVTHLGLWGCTQLHQQRFAGAATSTLSKTVY